VLRLGAVTRDADADEPDPIAPTATWSDMATGRYLPREAVLVRPQRGEQALLGTLQRKLDLKAEAGCRFFLLYDNVHRADILRRAYDLLRAIRRIRRSCRVETRRRGGIAPFSVPAR
jgi:hypothetical protein